MPSKQPKSLILAIHIDSAEINLAAGFVEEGKVNLVALHRTYLLGISKGNIIDKENFENSFRIAVQNFLDHNCKVADPKKCRELNLDVDSQGRLAFKKIAYNLLVSDGLSSRYFSPNIQAKVVQNILTTTFSQGSLKLIEGENLFTCTADTAITNLLVDDVNINPYQININFGKFSTGINFIYDPKSKQVYSKSVELGFQEFLNNLNNNSSNIEPLNPPCSIEELYSFLKTYNFNISGKSRSRTIFIRNSYANRSDLDEIFVRKAQYISNHLYRQFCDLDVNKVRFSPDFAKKLKINITGYMADFTTLKDCVALVFSHRLKEELNENKSQNSDSITSSSPSQANFVLNTATGLQESCPIPKANGGYQLIYQNTGEPPILSSRSLTVEKKVFDYTFICCNNPNDIVNYKLELDRFAAAIGLIYNFYLSEPEEFAKSNKFSVKKFFSKLFKFN